MEKKQNDRKELRTSFDMVTFATAIETLRKGEETIASLAERYEERQANREHANDTFIAELWKDTDEAKRVRSYLSSRRWTEEDIRKAELRLI